MGRLASTQMETHKSLSTGTDNDPYLVLLVQEIPSAMSMLESFNKELVWGCSQGASMVVRPCAAAHEEPVFRVCFCSSLCGFKYH